MLKFHVEDEAAVHAGLRETAADGHFMEDVLRAERVEMDVRQLFRHLPLRVVPFVAAAVEIAAHRS